MSASQSVSTVVMCAVLLSALASGCVPEKPSRRQRVFGTSVSASAGLVFHTYAYLVARNSRTVQSFEVDSTSGEFRSLGNPIELEGATGTPLQVEFHPTLDQAFVVTRREILSQDLDPASGKLGTPRIQLRFETPSERRLLFFGQGAGGLLIDKATSQIQSFRMDAEGRLILRERASAPLPKTLGWTVMDPSGRFLRLLTHSEDNGFCQIRTYAIDPEAGAVEAQALLEFAQKTCPAAPVYAPEGDSLYLGMPHRELRRYLIHPETGELTRGPAPVVSESSPMDEEVPSYLPSLTFAVRPGEIEGYQVFPGGRLRTLVTPLSRVKPYGEFQFGPFGDFLYSLHRIEGRVMVYSVRSEQKSPVELQELRFRGRIHDLKFIAYATDAP